MTIKSKYLSQLLKDFELLSEIIMSQIDMARNIFQQKENHSLDPELYEKIEQNEQLIDGLDLKIREEVINAIFLFTPKASDLRKIMAYHDMTIYLERVGDLVLNIAHFIQKFRPDTKGGEEACKKLEKMFTYAQNMVRNAIVSFTCENNTVAYETIQTDDKVDGLYKEVTQVIIHSFQNRKLSPEELENILFINGISYNLERIADNATNIAEATIYLTEGKDIRHSK